MALEQDSGCCLNLTEDTTNNPSTTNHITLDVENGDIVTSSGQYKISMKGELCDFFTCRSSEQIEVKTEALGHTDKDNCENDAINPDTSESQIENTFNSSYGSTHVRDAANSDPEPVLSASLAILKSESVQKIKDHCDERCKQVSLEDDSAQNIKQELNQNENIHTLSNISDGYMEDETETNTVVDSLKANELDDKSRTSHSLSGAVSNLSNLMNKDKVGQENEEHGKDCKTGEDENILGTNSSVTKENDEAYKQSLDISLGKPGSSVNEKCQSKKEKEDGLIKPKQLLKQSKKEKAFFLNKCASTAFQQTLSDVSQNNITSPSVDRYSDIMEKINQMVMPFQKELFPGRSTQTPPQYSSIQTSPISQNYSLHNPETTPTTTEHSSTQRSPIKTRSPKTSGKCLIHSIPKLMMCVDCKLKQCSQCILVDGTCRGHTLAEAPHLAIQREKIKLMKALETASCDLNQSDVNMKTVETEIQNLDVKCLLRREEIQQEFTSFMNLLIQQKNTVLQALDQEAEHRKQYLEGFVEQHRALQQKEGQLTDDVTSLVQNTEAVGLQPYHKLLSECEKFSSIVKSTLVPESSPVTSLLDNPFSLYREKTHFDCAITRDNGQSGDINFRKKTLHVNAGDLLALDQILEVPCFPTSSTQSYTVELLKFPRTKVWETSVSSLKGLTLNCDTTYCFESNVTYLLRVKVCLTIDQSALMKVEKVGKPTHLMIMCSDISDTYDDETYIELAQRKFSTEEERYLHTYSCCHPVVNLSPDTIAEISQHRYGTDKFTAIEIDWTVTKDGVEEKTGLICCFHCISAMEEYSSKSFEELRLEDYRITRKNQKNEEDIVKAKWRSSLSDTDSDQSDDS